MKFATGQYALALCDRCGQQYDYIVLRQEWNGLRVCPECFEEKHPQLELRARSADAEGLLNARVDRTENEVIAILGPDPFETISASSGIINVFEKSHGRSTSDTVRFRDGEGSFGITSADINKSAGFTITKVDANNYTFVAAGTATASTNIGGGSISAGPVTLSP